MWVYENLELVIGGIFVTGLAAHFAARWRHRRRYLALRHAYEDAFREARDARRDPAAVVREAELHREFIRACYLGWFEGLGRRVRTMAKLCAGLTLLAFFLKGPIERGEAEHAKRQARAAAAARAGPATTAAAQR